MMMSFSTATFCVSLPSLVMVTTGCCLVLTVYVIAGICPGSPLGTNLYCLRCLVVGKNFKLDAT